MALRQRDNVNPNTPDSAAETLAAPADPERKPVKKPTGPDPWGIRRAEVLLASLKGILSARVVASGSGEITEVHVLTESGLTPKQVVRNVESALLAQLGIKLDHRKISVAQTAEVLPIEAMEEQAIADKARRRGILFQRVEVTPTESPQRVKVAVTIERDGEELTATEVAGDAGKMRIMASARATVTLLDGLVPNGTIDLAGAKIVDAFDTSLAFVGIHVLEGRDTRLHVGSCEIKSGSEQAAALAVLDACNRWLQSML